MNITKQVHRKANGPMEVMVNSVACKQNFKRKQKLLVSTTLQQWSHPHAHF